MKILNLGNILGFIFVLESRFLKPNQVDINLDHNTFGRRDRGLFIFLSISILNDPQVTRLFRCVCDAKAYAVAQFHSGYTVYTPERFVETRTEWRDTTIGAIFTTHLETIQKPVAVPDGGVALRFFRRVASKIILFRLLRSSWIAYSVRRPTSFSFFFSSTHLFWILWVTTTRRVEEREREEERKKV